VDGKTRRLRGDPPCNMVRVRCDRFLRNWVTSGEPLPRVFAAQIEFVRLQMFLEVLEGSPYRRTGRREFSSLATGVLCGSSRVPPLAPAATSIATRWRPARQRAKNAGSVAVRTDHYRYSGFSQGHTRLMRSFGDV
jgi:hypothetical protein